MKQIVYEYMCIGLSVIAASIAIGLIMSVLFGPDTLMATAVQQYLGGLIK